MSRPRGMPSRESINREFPYQVAVPMVGGQEISGIRESGPYSSLCVWRGKVSDDVAVYEIFRFADPAQARSFCASIAGEAFDYRDQIGAHWVRGRGARRDKKRPY